VFVGGGPEEEDVKFEMFLLSSEVVVLVKLMMFFDDDDELNSSNEFMTKLDWILIDLEAFYWTVFWERRERERESDGRGKRTVKNSLERVKTIFQQGYEATPLHSFGFLITPRILESVV